MSSMYLKRRLKIVNLSKLNKMLHQGNSTES